MESRLSKQMRFDFSCIVMTPKGMDEYGRMLHAGDESVAALDAIMSRKLAAVVFIKE